MNPCTDSKSYDRRHNIKLFPNTEYPPFNHPQKKKHAHNNTAPMITRKGFKLAKAF